MKKKTVSKPMKAPGGAKHSKAMKAKSSVREQVLTQQLRDFGKVGGILDKRVGAHGSSAGSADAALRRHIIEKLRRLETLGSKPVEDDDILSKLSLSRKTVKKASFDDQLGGLSADIVDSELFAGGLLNTVDTSKPHSRDALLDKIMATREERLKRVEDNEDLRKKIKNVDIEWTDKVRFMLNKLTELKPKDSKAALRIEKGRSEVLSLLNKLSSAKTVAPIGARVETDAMKSERLLANLEQVLERKLESEPASILETTKSEGLLLRLLCRIPASTVSCVGYLCQLLSSIQPDSLRDIVRGLLLSEILVEFIQSRLPVGETAAEKFGLSERLNGIFIPELIQFFARLMETAVPENPPRPLNIKPSMESIENESYAYLDARVGAGELEVMCSDEDLYRLRCLHCLIRLSRTLLKIYSVHFPLPAVTKAFSRLAIACSRLDIGLLPEGLRRDILGFTESLRDLGSHPRPADIVTADKVTLLLANPTVTAQTLQKAGIVPQLEPKFDEKIDARRPKKRLANVELRQKLAKEKRGVIRELRKDAQFLADHHLKKTIASDEIRKKKTQAIINSMRSIE